ncbi:hypothetical protein LTS18_013523, partial [Coniosporium uncinatum]
MAPQDRTAIELKTLYHSTAKEISGQDGQSDSFDTAPDSFDPASLRDVQDMQRMGKHQQFRRNFRRFSTLSF